jgi:hypothetical protein
MASKEEGLAATFKEQKDAERAVKLAVSSILTRSLMLASIFETAPVMNCMTPTDGERMGRWSRESCRQLAIMARWY